MNSHQASRNSWAAVIILKVGLLAMVSVAPATKAGEPQAPARVKVIHPKKGDLERVSTQPVSIEAFESARLFARVSGFLKSSNVDIGDRVKRGDVLAVLDVPELEAQVKHDRLSVEQAGSRVIQAKTRVSSAEADLEAARLTVMQAEAAAKSAAAIVQYREKQWSRFRHLVESKAIEERLAEESKHQYEAAVESEGSAKAAVETAKAHVVAGAIKVEQAKTDFAAAEVDVKVVQATLDKSKVILSFATILSPYDGVVTQRSSCRGDYIRSADNGKADGPLLSVSRTDLMRAVASIPDRDVPLIDIGKAAELEIEALPGNRLTTKVARASAAEDPQTRTMRVEFDLPNPDGKLIQGMIGRVAIVLDKQRDVLSIPTSCLVGKKEAGKGTVYVIRDGRAKRVSVLLGSDNGKRVVIRDGLTAEDQVILDPFSSVSDGAEVAPSLWTDPLE